VLLMRLLPPLPLPLLPLLLPITVAVGFAEGACQRRLCCA
jgi:hypothetical protein